MAGIKRAFRSFTETCPGVSLYGDEQVKGQSPSVAAEFFVQNVIDNHEDSDSPLFELRVPSSAEDLDGLCRALTVSALANRKRALILIDSRQVSRSNTDTVSANSWLPELARRRLAGMAVFAWGHGQPNSNSAEHRSLSLRETTAALNIPTVYVEVVDDAAQRYSIEDMLEDPAVLFSEQHTVVPANVI